jgi:hypothetical protein
VLGKELATYEEMVKIESQKSRPRPIMLIGMYAEFRIFILIS